MVFFQAHRIAEAIRYDRMDTLQKLLAKGADPNAHEEYGRMPLELAALKGNVTAAALLIAAGASADMIYQDGTLLHIAAARGNVALAKLFLEKFPDMKSGLDDGRNTPLHLAAAAGHAEMVTFLIDAGFDPAVKNAENRNALYMAQRKSHPDVIEILEAYHEKNPLPRPVLPRQIAEAAPQADTPAAPAAAGNTTDGWHVLADDRIAHVTLDAAIGYKITEIFNFAARERTRLYHNLETRAESAESRDFDDIAEKAPLEEALERLRAAGRLVGADAVYTRGIGKPPARRSG